MIRMRRVGQGLAACEPEALETNLRTRRCYPVSTAGRCVPWAASRRAGLPRPGPACPVQVELPTGRTTWTGQAGSGCLWCVMGSCPHLGLPERPPEALCSWHRHVRPARRSTPWLGRVALLRPGPEARSPKASSPAVLLEALYARGELVALVLVAVGRTGRTRSPRAERPAGTALAAHAIVDPVWSVRGASHRTVGWRAGSTVVAVVMALVACLAGRGAAGPKV
jgi:hypothetical protein